MERTAAETVVHSSISLPHNDSIHADSQTPVSRLKARRQPPLIVSKAAYLNYLLYNNPDGEKVSWVFRERSNIQNIEATRRLVYFHAAVTLARRLNRHVFQKPSIFTFTYPFAVL